MLDGEEWALLTMCKRLENNLPQEDKEMTLQAWITMTLHKLERKEKERA